MSPQRKLKNKDSISSLKKKAWKVFSVYIRRRGADEFGFNSCVTCGVRKPWQELQSGHFIGGRRNALLFHELACHPQCFSCNVMKHGDQVNYLRFMERTYGQEATWQIEALNRVDKQFTSKELEGIIARYKVDNSN